ncbi:hypothetical protein SB782_35755, partial [Brevibacillus sp. SIMBA_076]
MDAESFTYLNEDDGSLSILDTDALDRHVAAIFAEITMSGLLDHDRAAVALADLAAATSTAYVRVVAMRVVE